MDLGCNRMVMEKLMLQEKCEFEDSYISKEIAGILEPGVKETRRSWIILLLYIRQGKGTRMMA